MQKEYLPKEDHASAVRWIGIDAALILTSEILGAAASLGFTEGAFLDAMRSGCVPSRSTAGRIRHESFWRNAMLENDRVVHIIAGASQGNFAPTERWRVVAIWISADDLDLWLRWRYATATAHPLSDPRRKPLTLDRTKPGALSEGTATNQVQMGERELAEIDVATGRLLGPDDELSRQLAILRTAKQLLLQRGVLIGHGETARDIGRGNDAVVKEAMERHKENGLGGQTAWRLSFDNVLGKPKKGRRSNEATADFAKVVEAKLQEIEGRIAA